MNASEYAAMHGQSLRQVIRAIKNGTLLARKVRGVWHIDADPTPGSRVDLKSKLTEVQIRKIEQGIESERQKIRAEAQADLVDDLVSLLSDCRDAYRAADLTREQVGALDAGFAKSLAKVEARRKAIA